MFPQIKTKVDESQFDHLSNLSYKAKHRVGASNYGFEGYCFLQAVLQNRYHITILKYLFLGILEGSNSSSVYPVQARCRASLGGKFVVIEVFG